MGVFILMQVRNKIRVVIADRDLFYLQKLKLCLERRGDMVVVGMADNGPAVFQMVQEGAPDVLLMDEPYGQLDIDLRFKLEDELIKLWKKTGTTVLFITHNIEEAVYLSQKIMVLTNKPTSVKTVLDNPLPLPRDVVSEEFVALRNKVTDLIKWW